MRADGYLLKPVSEEEIREEISFVNEVVDKPKNKLEVKCFGHFDVHWNGMPVVFNRKKSKELIDAINAYYGEYMLETDTQRRLA